jgi:hypothetical protein
MTSHRLLTRPWWVGMVLSIGLSLPALAQQAAPSDRDVARHGALAFAAAHGEQPRYGGTFLSVGNEEIPFYDLHQTSLGGVYAATAPAAVYLHPADKYSRLIRRVSSEQKGLDERALLASQRPSPPW